MSGLHIQFRNEYGPKGGRVEWTREWFPGLTLDALRAARDATRSEFHRLYPDGHTFGLVPRTFAASVLSEREDFAHLTGLDAITLSYALYQHIKAGAGEYADDPAQWTTLKADVFPVDTVTKA